jgi:leader peptidase (prepilin peptidase) / N-methyltransferase
VNEILCAAAAVTGLALAWPQRALIAAFRPAADAPAAACPPPVPDSQALAGPITGGVSTRRRQHDMPRPPSLATVGLMTAVLLAALSWRVHPWPVLGASACLVACGVPMAFIDMRLHRLPDLLTAPAFAGVMLCLVFAAATTDRWPSLGRAALGGAALAGAYLAAALIRPGHIGLGDSKAAASAGTLMAWFSWQTLLAGTFVALALAAAYGVVLLAERRATLHTRIAYGPALIGGSVIAVLLAAHGG